MRKLTLWLCAAALGFAAIACDGGGDDTGGAVVAPGVNALAAAADNARAAGSFAMEMTMGMDVDGEWLEANAEGVFDFRRQVGEMAMRISGPGIPRRFEKLEIDMIVDGDYGYMRMPPEFLLGNAWYRMGLGAHNAVGATGIHQLNQDPAQFLEFLRGTSEDEIEEVGTEDVRGVATTHYEADFSLEKVLEQAPNQEAVEDLEAKLGASIGTLGSIPVEAWIDVDGLPRRLELSAAGVMEISVDFFDYGTPVDVEAPEKFEKLPKALRG